MVKEPQPGRVKTRLGREIGMTAAAWWFRHTTAQTFRTLVSPKWDLILAVSPDKPGMTSRVWPAHLPRIPQGRGDLGARMARVFARFSKHPTCIIGADIPGITKPQIETCFAALGSYSGVISPSDDGGYWLIGLAGSQKPRADFLKNVRWSTQYAKADTIASDRMLNWAEGPPMRDVDTLDDLKALAKAAY